MEVVPACVLLYDGMKLGNQGKAYHDVHAVRTPSVAALQTFINELKGMS